jgi:hypothetical protein
VRALHGQSAHESDQLDIAILERDGQRALQARVRSPGGVTETDNTRSRNRRYRTKLAEAKRERAGKPKHEHKRARSIYIRQRGLLLQARVPSAKPIKIARTPAPQKPDASANASKGETVPSMPAIE